MVRFHTRIALGALALLATLALRPTETSAITQLVAIDFNHSDIDPDESIIRTGKLVQTPGDPLLLSGTIEQTYTESREATSNDHFIVTVTVRVPPFGDLVVVAASGFATHNQSFASDGFCPGPSMVGSSTITGGTYSKPAADIGGNLVLTGTTTIISTHYLEFNDDQGTSCVSDATEHVTNGRVLSFQGVHEFGSGVTISVGDDVELEGGPGASNQLSFPVTLSAPAPAGGVSVSYGTSDTTTQAGSDYQVTAGTLTFTVGQTSKTLFVPINGDPDIEPDETLTVTLSAAAGATIADGSGIGTILNDDFALVDFDWTMPDRFGLDANGNSLIDYFLTAEAISPPSWRVNFSYGSGGNCDPALRPVIKIDGVVVVLNDPALVAVDTSRCQAAYAFATEDVYAVSFDLFDAAGQLVGRAEHNVTVQDFLIVSLGDSVASGEGNPDIPGAPGWQNRQCHRSAFSGPALAAMALERADPRTSVTFVHLACSGASIYEGILARYRGQEPGPWLPPQVEVMDSLVGTREIDAVTVSAGANDVRFGAILIRCFLQTDCHLATTRNSALQLFNGGLALLPGDYDALGLTLRAPRYDVAPERTYITEYYDALRDQGGNFCDQAIFEEAGPVPFVGISGAESQWASTDMVVRLNQSVAAGASRNGWKYVGGIFDAFRTHGYCSNDRWIVQFTESLADQRNADGTLHPNEVGHGFYGGRIAANLTADLYLGGDLSKPRAPR